MAQDKILEALSGLIPENVQEKVSTVITAAFDEAVANLEKEYNDKLEEAFKTVTAEREKDWQVAEDGYRQAYEVITELRNRNEIQKQEFQETLEREYGKAYDMLVEERNKNQTISDDLYKQYDERLDQIKEFLIDRVDEFLAKKGDEYYEMARQDVLSDPCLAEHRVAFEKILEVAADYVAEEDCMLKTSAKVDELNRSLEQAKNQLRMMESKNTRLMTENTQMKDYLKQTKELIEEGVINEQKAREQKARVAEGRGSIAVNEPERHVVIGEATVSAAANKPNVEDAQPQTITEWQVLAGIKKNK